MATLEALSMTSTEFTAQINRIKELYSEATEVDEI